MDFVKRLRIEETGFVAHQLSIGTRATSESVRFSEQGCVPINDVNRNAHLHHLRSLEAVSLVD